MQILPPTKLRAFPEIRLEGWRLPKKEEMPSFSPASLRTSRKGAVHQCSMRSYASHRDQSGRPKQESNCQQRVSQQHRRKASKNAKSKKRWKQKPPDKTTSTPTSKPRSDLGSTCSSPSPSLGPPADRGTGIHWNLCPSLNCCPSPNLTIGPGVGSNASPNAISKPAHTAPVAVNPPVWAQQQQPHHSQGTAGNSALPAATPTSVFDQSFLEKRLEEFQSSLLGKMQEMFLEKEKQTHQRSLIQAPPGFLPRMPMSGMYPGIPAY